MLLQELSLNFLLIWICVFPKCAYQELLRKTVGRYKIYTQKYSDYLKMMSEVLPSKHLSIWLWKKRKGNWLWLILVGFWYVAASEREVIAILKLISQTARNFPGVFYNGKAGAILPVIGRILPFFAEPAFRLVILLFCFLNFPDSICSR